MQIKENVFVVTGGGNGIGRQLVLEILNRGGKVAMVDLSEEALKETYALAKGFENNLFYEVLNIADLEKVKLLPSKVIEKFGRVDGIINNAGIIQKFIPVNELEYSDIERVMNVNFYGTLYMIKEFLPYLLKNEGTAAITNVSSMGGFFPFPKQSAYGASKAAVKLLTEGLYAELKDTNVRVNLVLPGAINTNIAKNSSSEIISQSKNKERVAKKQKQYKMTSAEDAAKIIVKAIEKERLKTLVGSDAKFMDKFYRFFPKKAVDTINKKMKSI